MANDTINTARNHLVNGNTSTDPIKSRRGTLSRRGTWDDNTDPLPVFDDATLAAEPEPQNKVITPKQAPIAEDIQRVKKNLHAVIEGMHKKHSMLSRMANVWGPSPLWLKAIIALALLVPLVTIVFNPPGMVIALIAVVTSLVFVAYCTSSYLLGNHYDLDQVAVEELQSGIDSLADMLGDMISQLNDISNQLHAEIKKMSAENTRFGEQVNDLAAEGGELKTNNGALAQINNQLTEMVKVKLGATTLALSKLLVDHQLLLKEQIEKSKENEINHKNSLITMDAEIQKLQDINTQLKQQLLQTQQECEALGQMAGGLGKLQGEINKAQQKHHEDIEQLLTEQTQHAAEVGKKFGGVVDQVENLTEQYAGDAQKFSDLVERKGEMSSEFLKQYGVFNNYSAISSAAESRLKKSFEPADDLVRKLTAYDINH